MIQFDWIFSDGFNHVLGRAYRDEHSKTAAWMAIFLPKSWAKDLIKVVDQPDFGYPIPSWCERKGAR